MFRQVILGLLLTATAVASHAQQALPPTHIPGFYNTRTHQFIARDQSAAPDASATTKYTGTLNFDFKITLLEPVPSGYVILCFASPSLFDNNYQNYFDYYDEVAAKVSGSTATCTVSIPYSFSPITPTSDSFTTSYGVFIEPASQSTIPATLQEPSFNGELAAFDLPATGKTTTLPIDISF
jgi:hypothetical protein